MHGIHDRTVELTEPEMLARQMFDELLSEGKGLLQAGAIINSLCPELDKSFIRFLIYG